jgi:hypothetical protein
MTTIAPPDLIPVRALNQVSYCPKKTESLGVHLLTDDNRRVKSVPDVKKVADIKLNRDRVLLILLCGFARLGG